MAKMTDETAIFQAAAESEVDELRQADEKGVRADAVLALHSILSSHLSTTLLNNSQANEVLDPNPRSFIYFES